MSKARVKSKKPQASLHVFLLLIKTPCRISHGRNRGNWALWREPERGAGCNRFPLRRSSLPRFFALSCLTPAPHSPPPRSCPSRSRKPNKLSRRLSLCPQASPSRAVSTWSPLIEGKAMWGHLMGQLWVIYPMVNSPWVYQGSVWATMKCLQAAGHFVPGVSRVLGCWSRGHFCSPLPVPKTLTQSTAPPATTAPLPARLRSPACHGKTATSARAGIILCHVHRDQAGFSSRWNSADNIKQVINPLRPAI